MIPNIGYCFLFMITFIGLFYFYSPCDASFALNKTQNTLAQSVIANDSWTSKRDNLSINMKLEPNVPIIDKWTRMDFELRNHEGEGEFVKGNFTANATITDHDGRLFKFPEKTIEDGRFFLEYIFPDDGQHKVILQLYNNSRANTVASFDLNIPHPQINQDNFWSQLFQSRPF
ncbi:MAG: hypothetical protein AB7V56_08875 [Candidatus Nitrosocosmicus sp.]